MRLPLSYLWLRRGLETAIGFHFLVDFVRLAAACFLMSGLRRGRAALSPAPP